MVPTVVAIPVTCAVVEVAVDIAVEVVEVDALLVEVPIEVEELVVEGVGIPNSCKYIAAAFGNSGTSIYQCKGTTLRIRPVCGESK